MKKMGLLFSLVCMTFLLVACATTSPKTQSELQAGRRYFVIGYYKEAMRYLLPAAIDGNAEAQYAVGYLYYYGYGVTQDTNTGAVWITRAAAQHYAPAMTAAGMMKVN